MNWFDRDRIEEVWVTITRNKVRSFLTAFGVFWGILMLVIMSGTGTGLRRGVYKYIDGFASNACFIGAAPTNLPYKGMQKGTNWHINNKDLRTIQDSVPNIEYLSPVLWMDQTINNVSVGNKTGSYPVRGIYPNYAQIERQDIELGRNFNNIDIDTRRKVCLLGRDVYEALFPEGVNPLGREIRIGGIYCTVIGVISGITDISIGGKLDASILLPLTTLQQLMNRGDIIQCLAVTAIGDVKVVEDRIKVLLKKIHHIHPDDTQAVWSFNLEKEYKLFADLFDGVSILIWIIGSGTLLAGIVGVSNIMLVTVRERTREIGIRRALGAKPITILGQVMSESLVLTAIAGFPGLCVGVWTLHLADALWFQHMTNTYFYKPMITFGAAVISVVILLISGLLAGALPASRALTIKAIDAIREE